MSSSKSSGSSSSPPRAASPEAVVDLVRSALLGIAEAIRTWTDDDVAAFLAGDREITIRVGARPARGRRTASEDTAEQAEQVRKALGVMETRDAGMDYLERMSLSRDELRRLVAALDLPVSHSDNMERLRNRVVEALIGYRLRSNAIRGTTPEPITPADSK